MMNSLLFSLLLWRRNFQLPAGNRTLGVEMTDLRRPRHGGRWDGDGGGMAAGATLRHGPRVSSARVNYDGSAYLSICPSLCMSLHMHACMCACIICTQGYAFLHVRMFVYAYIYRGMSAHMRVYMRVCLRACAVELMGFLRWSSRGLLQSVKCLMNAGLETASLSCSIPSNHYSSLLLLSPSSTILHHHFVLF